MPEFSNHRPARAARDPNSTLYTGGTVKYSLYLLWTLSTLSAETAMPVGIFRGRFVSWQGSSSTGEFQAIAKDGQAFSCAFDSKTLVERDQVKIGFAAVARGDTLEVLVDRKTGGCYARIVRFADQLPKAKTVARVVAPQGDRTISGIVMRRNPVALTLRTRGGVRMLALRRDTRFLSNGVKAEDDDLPVNTRVFVRAGRSPDGAIEAYQVSWGRILVP